MVKTNRISPNSFTKIERVVIDRFAELSHEDTGKEHTGRAQANALYFDASQRHPHHANEGEHADSVRYGLRLVEIEQPVHASDHRRGALYFGASACSVGLEVLIE
jgi:hypothetical protein